MTERLHHGVVIAGHGSAIVSATHDDHGLRVAPADLVVVGIQRLPFDLSVVAEAVLDLPFDQDTDLVVVDAAGLGAALWAAAGNPTHRRGWDLYQGRGVDRQALVDELVVAVHAERIHFAPDLDEMGAMTKALASFRREVRDDGQIGSELVTALCLAIAKPRRGYGPPRVY